MKCVLNVCITLKHVNFLHFQEKKLKNENKTQKHKAYATNIAIAHLHIQQVEGGSVFGVVIVTGTLEFEFSSLGNTSF